MAYGRVDERTGYGSRPQHAHSGNGGYAGQYPGHQGSPAQPPPPQQELLSYNRYEVDAHLDEMEAELTRLREERDEAVNHAEDLAYQIEVLRSKLHEFRRGLHPQFNNISGRVDQMLRNAQQQADQVRAAAQQEAQRLQSEVNERRMLLETELAERRQRGEAEVNESVAWAERVRSEA